MPYLRRILRLAVLSLCWSALSTSSFGQGLDVNDRLAPGDRLLAGESLASADGRYELAYQTDGNLVLYDRPTGVALWWSGTVDDDPGEAVMQDDGNFVVYDGQGSPVWWAGTSGYPGAHLVLQDDANAVVYAPGDVPVWWSAGAIPGVIALTGRVLDAVTGAPIAGAMVTVNRGAASISDALGRYSVLGWPDSRGYGFAAVSAENYIGNIQFINAAYADLYLLPIEYFVDEPIPLPDW